MPGLDPGIHLSPQEGSSRRGWIAGSSPAMTRGESSSSSVGISDGRRLARSRRPPIGSMTGLLQIGHGRQVELAGDDDGGPLTRRADARATSPHPNSGLPEFGIF